MNGFVTGLFTGILSVGAIAISPGQDARPGSSPRTAPDVQKREQVFHIDIFLRDAMGLRGNVESREVQIVRDCLRPVLTRYSDPEECAAAVRNTLAGTFASRTVIEEVDRSYKAIWDPELDNGQGGYRVICCDALSIEVDVEGTIVSVPVSVGTFLD